MVSNTFYKYPHTKGVENTVYLADKEQNEVKIGGNAVAIIMLTEYMNTVGTDKYEMLCRELGNGILELFDAHGQLFPCAELPESFPEGPVPHGVL